MIRYTSKVYISNFFLSGVLASSCVGGKGRWREGVRGGGRARMKNHAFGIWSASSLATASCWKLQLPLAFVTRRIVFLPTSLSELPPALVSKQWIDYIPSHFNITV